MPFPQRTVAYRDDVFKSVIHLSMMSVIIDFVFRCLTNVKDKMAVWSGKSWFHMLVYQGNFEADVNECDAGIVDCLTIFMVSFRVSKNVTRPDDLSDGCPNGRDGAPEGRRRMEGEADEKP